MGVNYYIKIDNEPNLIHIGKNSLGWRFIWEWLEVFKLFKRFEIKLMLEDCGKKTDHGEKILTWLTDLSELVRIIENNPFTVIDIPLMTEDTFFSTFTELCTNDKIKIVDEYEEEISVQSLINLVKRNQYGLTDQTYNISSKGYTTIYFDTKENMEKIMKDEWTRYNLGFEVRIGSMVGYLTEFS